MIPVSIVTPQSVSSAEQIGEHSSSLSLQNVPVQQDSVSYLNSHTTVHMNDGQNEPSSIYLTDQELRLDSSFPNSPLGITRDPHCDDNGEEQNRISSFELISRLIDAEGLIELGYIPSSCNSAPAIDVASLSDLEEVTSKTLLWSSNCDDVDSFNFDDLSNKINESNTNNADTKLRSDNKTLEHRSALTTEYISVDFNPLNSTNALVPIISLPSDTNLQTIPSLESNEYENFQAHYKTNTVLENVQSLPSNTVPDDLGPLNITSYPMGLVEADIPSITRPSIHQSPVDHHALHPTIKPNHIPYSYSPLTPLSSVQIRSSIHESSFVIDNQVCPIDNICNQQLQTGSFVKNKYSSDYQEYSGAPECFPTVHTLELFTSHSSDLPHSSSHPSKNVGESPKHLSNDTKPIKYPELLQKIGENCNSNISGPNLPFISHSTYCSRTQSSSSCSIRQQLATAPSHPQLHNSAPFQSTYQNCMNFSETAAHQSECSIVVSQLSTKKLTTPVLCCISSNSNNIPIISQQSPNNNNNNNNNNNVVFKTDNTKQHIIDQNILTKTATTTSIVQPSELCHIQPILISSPVKNNNNNTHNLGTGSYIDSNCLSNQSNNDKSHSITPSSPLLTNCNSPSTTLQSSTVCCLLRPSGRSTSTSSGSSCGSSCSGTGGGVSVSSGQYICSICSDRASGKHYAVQEERQQQQLQSEVQRSPTPPEQNCDLSVNSMIMSDTKITNAMNHSCLAEKQEIMLKTTNCTSSSSPHLLSNCSDSSINYFYSASNEKSQQPSINDNFNLTVNDAATYPPQELSLIGNKDSNNVTLPLADIHALKLPTTTSAAIPPPPDALEFIRTAESTISSRRKQWLSAFNKQQCHAEIAKCFQDSMENLKWLENNFEKCTTNHLPLFDLVIWSSKLPYICQLSCGVHLDLLKSACMQLIIVNLVYWLANDHKPRSLSTSNSTSKLPDTTPTINSTDISNITDDPPENSISDISKDCTIQMKKINKSVPLDEKMDYYYSNFPEFHLLNNLTKPMDNNNNDSISSKPTNINDNSVDDDMIRKRNTNVYKLIYNLAIKLRMLNLDPVELGCLKLILLLNPDSMTCLNNIRSLIELLRDQVYAGLEYYCNQVWPNAPHGRMGRLLLKLSNFQSVAARIEKLICSNELNNLLNNLESIFSYLSKKKVDHSNYISTTTTTTTTMSSTTTSTSNSIHLEFS
ncbi:retinoid-x-receptor (RXR) [Schistosoma mansoni]|uniref:retinoid-x-receptor (RXR) n=1 Tax=Schistosoma mansoni TaxID=6183 RepID=UPI0001A6224B|nr:retinoid-x-receptor (RXR) [Schistosoma mansoni]|eukprot:XP_018655548.1 retinoid-x-receptor (RXR) [Schistosoma mansoni]